MMNVKSICSDRMVPPVTNGDARTNAPHLPKNASKTAVVISKTSLVAYLTDRSMIGTVIKVAVLATPDIFYQNLALVGWRGSIL